MKPRFARLDGVWLWVGAQCRTLGALLAAHSNTIMAVVSTVALVFAFYSYRQTLGQSRDALAMQQREFRLRNRPILCFSTADITVESSPPPPGHAGPVAFITLPVINAAGLPALDVSVSVRAYAPGGTATVSRAQHVAALAPGAKWVCDIDLHDSVLQAAASGNNRVTADVIVRYEGIAEVVPGWFETHFHGTFSIPRRWDVQLESHATTYRSHWDEPLPSTPVAFPDLSPTP